VDKYERKPVSMKALSPSLLRFGGFNVLYLVSSWARPLGHVGQPAVSRIAARVGLYALAGTLVGAVASGMLLWVLLLL
jgi:hypothetical protein